MIGCLCTYGGPCMRSLSDIVTETLREIAPRGIDGERLRKQVLRLEGEVRTLARDGHTGTLVELWDLAEANLVLDALSMDERGAWQMELASGQEIRLGRRYLQQRVDRFFQVVVPVLATEMQQVNYIDLRYTNGFSVGWSNQMALQAAELREFSRSE